MKFKVGDFVMVKKDLVAGEHYDGVYFNGDMRRYHDVYTVCNVLPQGYHLKNSEGSVLCGKITYWMWTDSMLEPYYDDYEIASDDEINLFIL